MTPWYGFDLDGTLAEYDHWRGASHVGKPIAKTVALLKTFLAQDKDARIFTARVFCPTVAECPSVDHWVSRYKETKDSIDAIEAFCLENFGRVLPITCTKDFGMVFLYDDRAKQVIQNTGELLEDLYYLTACLAGVNSPSDQQVIQNIERVITGRHFQQKDVDRLVRQLQLLVEEPSGQQS